MTVPNPGAFLVPPNQPHSAAVGRAGSPLPGRSKPPLSREATHRARLAGGVGGGVAWLGLGIAQACAVLLLLAVGIPALLRTIAAWSDGRRDPWPEILAEVLPWLASPWAVALMIGVPVGLVIALVGLWISARMLRRPGLAHPIGVSWAAFGISLVAASVLSGLGSVAISPFSGALPGVGPGPGIPDIDTDDGIDPGVDGDALIEWADPDRILAIVWPFVTVASLASLIVPIVLSVFAWWWMAHAMRPAAETAESAESTEAV